MEKQVTLRVPNDNDIEEKVLRYFNRYNFTLLEHSKGHFCFGIKASVAANRHSDPLIWESQIVIDISGHTLVVKYYAQSDSEMKTKTEESIWNWLVKDFKQHPTDKTGYPWKLAAAIPCGKSGRLQNWFRAIAAVLGTGLVILLVGRLLPGFLPWTLVLILFLCIVVLIARSLYKRSGKY